MTPVRAHPEHPARAAITTPHGSDMREGPVEQTPARGMRISGAAYLVMCLLVVINTALHDKGLPSLSSSASGQFPLGTSALAFTAMLSMVLLVAAIVGKAPSRLQWVLVILVALWMGSPWLSLGLQEGIWEVRLFTMAATGTGVALASAMAGPTMVRWVFYVSGAAWAGASLLAGAAATASGSAVLPRALAADEGDRFTRWIQVLAVDVPDGSVQALEGLSLHRNLLGMSLALVLVLQTRHVLTVRGSTRLRILLMILGPGLAGTALLWTMSRTSIVAGAAALLVGLVPVEKVRRPVPLLALGLTPVLIAIAPLLLRDYLAATLEPGTLRWRALLWQDLLARSEVWNPLGAGPGTTLPRDARHTHNQALETLVNGGLLGAMSLLLLCVGGTIVAARVAGRDRRAAFSVLVAAALLSQTEIIVSSQYSLELNAASVIVIAVVVSAAQLVGSVGTPPTATRLQGGPDQR